MKHKEYTWFLDGKKIHAQSWMPGKPPTAILTLVHGMGEHSGRYLRWASMFCDAGYGIIATDLYGHGKTEGKTGHVKNYRVLLEQVDLLLEKSEELFPGIPRILYGHSMGGNIVINYAISKDPPVSAIIATSPWLRLAFPVSSLEKFFSKIASSIAPGLRIKAKGVSAERLSHDPELWEEVRCDPLVHRQISTKYVFEIIGHGEYAIRHVNKINKPFLIMHGNEDEITSFEASEELVVNSSERTQLKIWEGLRHELHNELDRKEVFDYVLNWIEEQKL